MNLYPRNIIHQLTSGVAGWLTYEQMRSRANSITEHSLYRPIEDIAAGRGWEVETQYPLENIEQRLGAPSSIDFCIVSRSQRLIILIEVKFVNAQGSMAGRLSSDARKLLQVNVLSLNRQIAAGRTGVVTNSVKGFRIVRAIMLSWKGERICHIIRREDPVIQDQFCDIVRQMANLATPPQLRSTDRYFLKTSPSRPVGATVGSIRSGSTITDQRFWVLSLVEIKGWKEIRQV